MIGLHHKASKSLSSIGKNFVDFQEATKLFETREIWAKNPITQILCTYFNVYRGGRVPIYELLQKPKKTANLCAP